MKKSIEKRGQKIAKRFSKLTRRVGEESTDHIRKNLVDRISHVKSVRLLVIEWSLLVLMMIFLSLTQAFWYSESYATETYTSGGTYTEATLGKVNSLNPLFASTSSEKALSKLMFATLTDIDYSGHTGLGLAESITMDDSGRIWTVKLRNGLTWSDGQPLTNEDIIFTIDLIKDPKTNTIYTNNVSGVTVEEGEDGSLIFTLNVANVYFNTALDLPIVPKHILKDASPELLLEHAFSSSPVCSGAFMYNATQSIGVDGEKVIYLMPNQNYYKGKPMLSSFTVHAFLSESDILDAINSNTVSASAELGSEYLDQITNNSISMRQSALNYGVYAFINLDSEVLKDLSLRQSLREGLNLSSLRSNLNGEPPLDYPLISSQIEITDYPELPEEDFIKARAKILEALAGKEDTIRIVTVNTDYLPPLSAALSAQLNDLGFTTTTEVYEPNQDFMLNILRSRNYDILLYEIGLGPDPDLMAYYHSTQASSGGYNLSNYRNSIVNDLLASARTTTDHTLRTKKYETFLEQWVNDVPAIGIYQPSLAYYVNKNVRTFSSENSLVYATDRFNDVIYWAAEKTSKSRTP